MASLTYTSLTGADDVIYKGIPKLMQFEVELPVGFKGGFFLDIIAAGYANDEVIKFCGIDIVKIGKNMPCTVFSDVLDTAEVISTKVTAE